MIDIGSCTSAMISSSLPFTSGISGISLSCCLVFWRIAKSCLRSLTAIKVHLLSILFLYHRFVIFFTIIVSKSTLYFNYKTRVLLPQDICPFRNNCNLFYGIKTTPPVITQRCYHDDFVVVCLNLNLSKSCSILLLFLLPKTVGRSSLQNDTNDLIPNTGQNKRKLRYPYHQINQIPILPNNHLHYLRFHYFHY